MAKVPICYSSFPLLFLTFTCLYVSWFLPELEKTSLLFLISSMISIRKYWKFHTMSKLDF